MQVLQVMIKNGMIAAYQSNASLNRRMKLSNATSGEQWVPMSEAAQAVNVNLSKISRLASQKKIKSQTNPYDERTKLVDLNEVKRYFRIQA